MAGIITLMTICALIVYFWKNREQRNGGDVCEIDVIGLDSPCVDLAVNVRCFPKPNGAERIQNLSWQGGGKVASGMVAAARLGLCCGIMGNVGDDKYGTFCLRDFQDHGIDTEQMCVRKNRTTNFDIVI